MNHSFLTNESKITFIKQIEDSLKTCKAFSFSVSFIKKAGLILILKEIESALKQGASGKIMTSTYQNFTDIGSLEVFLSLQRKYPNFECHLDHESFHDRGFHAKGYLFDYGDHLEAIIGSSNITRFALLKNIEWNVLFLSKKEQTIALDLTRDYDKLWDITEPLTKEIIEIYRLHLEYAIEKWDMDYFSSDDSVKPNYMQRKALKELRRYRDLGVNKALVVAATGSGKTHLSAFDARNFGAKRLLFVVHRENILREAIKTYRIIFGVGLSYGLYTGNEKDFDRDFVFATNLLISKNLSLFDRRAFDYIVIDEVHHAVASTYQKIIEYFEPEFLLGLTATPDRMDAESVYGIFDRNVPFDLRIRDAILNDLIVPFRYYGIRDQLVNYELEDVRALVNEITDDEHCAFITSEINKHKPENKLKAIAFCKTVDHARRMAENMAHHGFHTRHLTGIDDVGERIKAFNDLQDEEHVLEIIFTVDILNEGVDIPGINMVLFLRPTESSTIFIQQLGRGLRKYQDKLYLTVLDFIGNSYKRSVQVIKALGSLSKKTVIEKRYLNYLIREDFKPLDIPGVEIHFDPLSKEEIEHYIRHTNFNTIDYLKKDYENFKKFLKNNTYPLHIDYLNNDYAPDLMRFMKSKMRGGKNFSYYMFLEKIGEDIPIFTERQIDLIKELSEILPLTRTDEYEIVYVLMQNDTLTEKEIKRRVLERQTTFLEDQFENAFMRSETRLKTIVKNQDDTYQVNSGERDERFDSFLFDLIDYGLSRYQEEFGDFEGLFKLYGNYSTEHVMMALCEHRSLYMKGTKIEEDKTVYIFVTLKKKESQLEHLKYQDRFIDTETFQWESETNTTFEKNRGLIGSKICHLFIRKTKEEDGITLPYTYIGSGRLENPRVSDNPKKTLIFDVLLDLPITEHIVFEFNLIDEDLKA